jgi:hypothetical protein
MSVEQIVDTYREQIELIIITVWKKSMECIINDFTFNIKNGEQFTNIILKCRLYDLQIFFLLGKGFKK